jgi:transcriptional antiterminator RfaH
MSDSTSPAWYAVQRQPHGESRAAFNLAHQGFEVYSPRYLKTRRHARQLRRVVAPFFPRYLFANLDLAIHRWRSVNGSFGVSGLLGAPDHPSRLPGAIIDALRAREDKKGYITVTHPAER